MPPEFMKGGIDSMLTYGDFIAKGGGLIACLHMVILLPKLRCIYQ